MSILHRFWKLVGESGFWKRTGKVHLLLYRLTGGILGHWTVVTNLLLTTKGRRSGRERTVPLAYMADGKNFVVVASNGGADRHPAWWLNLERNPQATVQVGFRKVPVHATRASSEERERLWAQLKDVNPFYSVYEQITDREIPVVVLRPE